MNDHVWLCNAMSSGVVTGGLETDIWISDRANATLGVKANRNGQPVSQDKCPKRIWGDEHAPLFKRMPDLFDAQDQWVLSSRVAEIMHKFDLGGGALYPISEGVFQKNNKTRVEGEFFSWIFGNTKTAFLEQHSPNVRAMGGPGGREWCAMHALQKDNDVAVSSAVLTGPDVWVDPILFKSLFLSAALGDALVAQGMKVSMRLLRCRVV
jgi:hypothetical protein